MAKKRLDNNEQPVDAHASAKLAAAEKIEFDEWYSMREAAIPRHHYREILKADFKSRGLKELETVDAWDKALQKYGVSL